MKKFIGYSLGTLIGISHIGMIGMIARKESLPKINLPIGDYTSYTVQANKEGYTIKYRAHDPKVLTTTEVVNRPAGLLGLGKKESNYYKEYYMVPEKLSSGQILYGNPNIACLKKQGSGEGTGRLVGGGLSAAVVTQTGLASIPVIGWVLAGAATMVGMDHGAEIGGQMAKDLAKECNEVDEKLNK